MNEDNARKTLASITKQLTLQEELIQSVKNDVSSLKVDSQFYIKSTKDIIPGSKCKVTFNNDGIVTSGGDLTKTDIPTIDITQVDGLYDSLAGKASKGDTDRITTRIDGLFTDRGIPYGEGVKVTFDANGMIVSTGSLNVDDIPAIPISKVENLQEIIDDITTSSEKDDEYVHPVVTANTSVKVTYDKNGHILHGSELGINDMPRELINRINEIESTLVDMAPKKTVELLSKQVSDLVDKVEAYPKVSTSGRVHEVSTIDDIDGLSEKLNEFVTYDDITNLQTEISTISSLLVGRKESPTGNDPAGTCSRTTMELKRDIESVDDRVSKIYDNIPVDKIMSEFERLDSMIRDLNDRLIDIEKKVGGSDVLNPG